MAQSKGDLRVSLLEMREISFTFRSARAITKIFGGINLRQEAGEFLCLLGPSGCGKTSLLSLVAGFLSPCSGQILFRGQAIRGPGHERPVIFQNHHLFPWKTALGNVKLPLLARGLSKAAAEAEARNLLAMVKLQRYADFYPHQLSGGMQQRVALVRALAANPELLLMDEPFAALDPFTRRFVQNEVLSILRPLRRSLILVTHNLDEAVLFADRIVLLGKRPSGVLCEYSLASLNAQAKEEVKHEILHKILTLGEG
jgi:NitT/TauT family transport system ATP-binding protein